MKYFEVAVAEGEGTLTEHFVLEAVAMAAVCFFTKATQVIAEHITEARFNEFREIHGGTVAV